MIVIFSRATSATPNFAVIRQRAAGVHKAFLRQTKKDRKTDVLGMRVDVGGGGLIKKKN